MVNLMTEAVIAYAFAIAIALFVCPPIILFAVLLLLGMMRSTGETIGSSDRQNNATVVARPSKVHPRLRRNRPLTMLNTA